MKSPLMAPNLLCSSLSLDRAGINLSQETLPKRGRGREAWIVAPGQSQSFFISCVHSDTRSSQHLWSAYYRPGWVWGEKKCLWHNLYSQKGLAGGKKQMWISSRKAGWSCWKNRTVCSFGRWDWWWLCSKALWRWTRMRWLSWRAPLPRPETSPKGMEMATPVPKEFHGFPSPRIIFYLSWSIFTYGKMWDRQD